MRNHVKWALLAIAVSAAVSRTPLTVVGVLQAPIRESLGLDYSTMGLLTTIPVVVFFLSALVIGRLKIRFGLGRVLGVGLMFLSAGLLLRVAGGVTSLLVGTALVGLGISSLNVLIPAAVKTYFPQHVGAANGLYTVFMYITASVGAATSVPLCEATGSWRLTLCVWLPFALLAALLWWSLGHREESRPAEGKRSMDLRELLRRPITWLLILMMIGQALIYYSITAWLSAILTSRGFSPDMAGRFTSIVQMGGIAGAVICAAALSKLKRQEIFCAMIGVGFILEMGLLAFARSTWMLMLCAVLLGICCCSSLSVINCLAAMRAKDPEETAGMTALVQTAGYPVAAVGPVLLGRLYDVTASWLPGLAILTFSGLLYALAGARAGREGA